MKKFTLSIVAVMAMSTFAVADTWVGPYAGLQAGYNGGNMDTRAEDGNDAVVLDGFNVDGFTGGIFAGYNWQVYNDLLLGVEGEYNLASADDSITMNEGWGSWGENVEQNWDASLRLRAGMDMGDYMPYVTAGIAWAGVETHGWTSFSGSDDHDATLTGFTVGAGVERKINENLSARIQYRYSDYGDETWTLDPSNDYDTGKVEYNAHMLTVGVIYRFSL